MFHALTKEIEEEFFADNMSVFIALSPSLIDNPTHFTYDDFILHDWQLLEEGFPALMGIQYRV